MDLYAIHKLYGGQSTGDNYGSGTISSKTTSDNKSLWDSHFADRDEFARFLNMMLAKSKSTETGKKSGRILFQRSFHFFPAPLMDGPSLRAYDVAYDDSSSEDPSTTSVGLRGGNRASSTDFVSSLLSPFSQGTGRISSSFNTSGNHPSGQLSGSSKLPTLADQFT